MWAKLGLETRHREWDTPETWHRGPQAPLAAGEFGQEQRWLEMGTLACGLPWWTSTRTSAWAVRLCGLHAGAHAPCSPGPEQLHNLRVGACLGQPGGCRAVRQALRRSRWLRCFSLPRVLPKLYPLLGADADAAPPQQGQAWPRPRRASHAPRPAFRHWLRPP